MRKESSGSVRADRGVSRRDLLRGALAGAAFTIIPRHVLGGPGFIPPSEQLTRAVIGIGGMGMGHVADINTEARLLAVCDVDAKHLAAGVARGGADVKGYRDFREVLARQDIDIIHIVTPPHWHALMCVAAAAAGKDIWCEKPFSRTIGEGEQAVAAVRRFGRVLRINTWFRFKDQFYDSGMNVPQIKRIVLSGMLGWPIKATVGASTGFAWKLESWCGRTDLKPEPIPPELDYDFWLGPAPVKPYHPHRVHGSFRGYWDYDGGGLGDMGMHYLDPVQYLLDKDNTSPVEIEADTAQQHPDAALPWRSIRMKYADGCEIILDGSNNVKDRVPFLEGPDNALYKNYETKKGNVRDILGTLPDPEPQITEFTYSVKTRRKFALNETNAHRSCTLVNLAVIAVRLGRPLKFDPVAQRFIGDDAANRLVKQPMRSPWNIYA